MMCLMMLECLLSYNSKLYKTLNVKERNKLRIGDQMSIGVPKTIEWVNGKVKLINQLKLPYELEYIVTDDYRRVARAIKTMEIRGAPAIGVAAALALALAATKIEDEDLERAVEYMKRVASELRSTRPTAINLFWAIDRVMRVVYSATDVEELKKLVMKEALNIWKEDIECNRKIGEYGEKLLDDGDTVITICNAGSLATVYYGTATAPVYIAKEKGKLVNVIVMETRPYLQGARLTAFELKMAGVPVRIVTDNQIGIVSLKEKINIALVGADRVTKDGHVVNKIGTYLLALVAKERGFPLYVAAPTSTIDLKSSIDDVIIERRPGDEVLFIFGKRIAPDGVDALYYAFDITPPSLVAGVITEKGIAYPPYNKSLRKIVTQ